MTEKIPFLKPNPPKLSKLLDQLAEIEASNIYSNYGPVNTRFESAFGGGGRGAGGTWVALPRWPCPGRPRGGWGHN